MSIRVIFLQLQTGGYTTANYIWDLMQARRIFPSLLAVEAYHRGLKVSLCPLVIQFFVCFRYFLIVCEFIFVIAHVKLHS